MPRFDHRNLMALVHLPDQSTINNSWLFSLDPYTLRFSYLLSISFLLLALLESSMLQNRGLSGRIDNNTGDHLSSVPSLRYATPLIAHRYILAYTLNIRYRFFQDDEETSATPLSYLAFFTSLTIESAAPTDWSLHCGSQMDRRALSLGQPSSKSHSRKLSQTVPLFLAHYQYSIPLTLDTLATSRRCVQSRAFTRSTTQATTSIRQLLFSASFLTVSADVFINYHIFTLNPSNASRPFSTRTSRSPLTRESCSQPTLM